MRKCNKRDIQVFVQFLKETASYDAFLNNFNTNNNLAFRIHQLFFESWPIININKHNECRYWFHWLKNVRLECFLLDAFDWETSVEGFDFWDEMNLHWSQFCKVLVARKTIKNFNEIREMVIKKMCEESFNVYTQKNPFLSVLSH